MKKWMGALAAVLALGLLYAAPAVAQSEAKEEAEPAADAPPEGWAPLEFELPEPFFGGTPLDYWSPNLEPESFKPRDPFFAPPGTTNLAADAEVTSSFDAPLVGELAMLTDGDKSYAKSSMLELGEGVQWMQLDFGAPKDLYAVLLWHFHEGKRVYFDIVVQASNDPEFEEGVTTLYNNDHDNSAGLGQGDDKEYIESEKGRLIDAGGVNAQYLRLYSNGNTANDKNHYVEVEVYGK